MQPTEVKSLYSLKDVPPWGHKVFDEFTKDMLSDIRPFPCVLGVEGFKQGSLRFVFIDSISSIDAMKKLAEELKGYLKIARSLGKNTSFVAFFKPEALKTLEEYEQQFWKVLSNLHHLDEMEWPHHIPTDPDHYLWEFSFYDEPMFVVCNTPAHKKRASRKSSTFMITFQPRWVFDGISGDTIVGKQFKKIVRERLEQFDEVEAHPALDWYGNKKTREWRQYFLMDDNQTQTSKCPFHASLEKKQTKIIYQVDHLFEHFRVEEGAGGTLEKVVMELLPVKGTGYVEVQKDEPFKAHPAHTHPTNEILHILSGSVSIEVGGQLITCKGGDRIYLPKDTVHASLAGMDGCLYVIAVLKE